MDLSPFNTKTSVNKVQRFYVMTVVIVAKEFDVTSKNYGILKSELSQWKQNDKRSAFQSHFLRILTFCPPETIHPAVAQFGKIGKRSRNSEKRALQNL
jgi:hypothetical protein